MTTIVMNTLNGAVTEYDWSLTSLAPTVGANADGLFSLGGDTDDGDDIDASLLSGLFGGEKKLHIASIYLAIRGEDGSEGNALVKTKSTQYPFPVVVQADGVARAATARGIRENYLGVGYENVDGAAFCIERLDAEIIESKQRRG